MTYLELCQAVIRDAGGIAGTIPSVNNQVGEFDRVVNWVNDAYRYILNKHADWTFLRKEFTFVTAPGTGDYPATALGLADFGEWKLSAFHCYTTAMGEADEQRMPYIPEYDNFRDRYKRGPLRASVGRPLVISQRPDEWLTMWPVPDMEYTFTGEYMSVPPALAANDDLPVFHSRFHDAIKYRALMFYAEYEGDATLFAAAQSELARVMARMEGTYLPKLVIGGAMA